MNRLAQGFLLAGALFFMGAMASPLRSAAELALGRVSDSTTLFVRLNGTPVALGVLTSTGTSVNQGTTAVTFTFAGGACYKAVCDAAAVLNIGSTASTDYTSANFGFAMTPGVDKYFCVRDTDTNISLDTTGGTANCPVHKMQ